MTNAYNIDCMNYMKNISDKFYDLAVVDPPYGIGESGATNKTRGKFAKSKEYVPFSGEDKTPPDKNYFIELFRVSKNQIIFGANHFIDMIPYRSSCWLVWDKENGETDFADCELAWTSFKSAVRIFRFRWQGMLQGNMKNKEERVHPTQKPQALYKWIFSKYAWPGCKIIDTHLGSGMSRIAAHDLGLDFDGCEKSEHYFAEHEKLFKKHMSQQTLFAPGENEKQLFNT